MNKVYVLVLLSLVQLSLAAQDLKCQAIFEWLDNGQLHYKRQAMPKVINLPNLSKYQIDTTDALFTINIVEETFHASINFPPNYTSAVISSGEVSGGTPFTLSFVENTNVYKIKCQ